MPEIMSGGAVTHVLRSGHGPEDALLLHCMLGHAKSMKPLMAGLADTLSMACMDLPGHGQSADWDPARDYGQMALDMGLGLLDRPTHLIGHSFGAYTALRMAVERPQLVRSLTLIEPVLFAAAPLDILDAHGRQAASHMSAIAADDLVAAARTFTDIWGAGSPWDDLKPATQAYLADRMPLILASEPCTIEDAGEVLPRLGAVTMPCLLIEGAASPPIIGAIQSELARQLPQARREVVAGAAHMAPLTHPEEVAALVKAFIRDQPRSAVSI